jgi:hypothetical protein
MGRAARRPRAPGRQGAGAADDDPCAPRLPIRRRSPDDRRMSGRCETGGTHCLDRTTVGAWHEGIAGVKRTRGERERVAYRERPSPCAEDAIKITMCRLGHVLAVFVDLVCASSEWFNRSALTNALQRASGRSEPQRKRFKGAGPDSAGGARFAMLAPTMFWLRWKVRPRVMRILP